MTDELEEMARRAVAAGWRWLDGVRGFDHGKAFRVVEIDLRHRSCPEGNAVIHWDGEVNSVCYSMAGRDGLLKAALPDLAARATLGCLEGLVADAWDAEVMVLAEVIRSGPHAGKVSHRVAIFRPEKTVDWGWTERYIFEASPDRAFRPMSRAEALVAALEAAPAREVKS